MTSPRVGADLSIALHRPWGESPRKQNPEHSTANHHGVDGTGRIAEPDAFGHALQPSNVLRVHHHRDATQILPDRGGPPWVAPC